MNRIVANELHNMLSMARDAVHKALDIEPVEDGINKTWTIVFAADYRTGVVCLDSAETYYICNGTTMIEVYGKDAAVLALTQAWPEEAVR